MPYRYSDEERVKLLYSIYQAKKKYDIPIGAACQRMGLACTALCELKKTVRRILIRRPELLEIIPNEDRHYLL